MERAINAAALFRNSANLRMKMELESVAALNLFQDNQRETKYTSARDTYAVDRTRKADDLNQRYRGVAIFRPKSLSRQPASLGNSIAPALTHVFGECPASLAFGVYPS